MKRVIVSIITPLDIHPLKYTFLIQFYYEFITVIIVSRLNSLTLGCMSIKNGKRIYFKTMGGGH